MTSFQTAYDSLNDAQRRAVDTIDGPLLVLAGPGTGKTQLLSARVANILTKTDVSARNILCLTFTESGAQNMRERLRSFIGDAAYDVAISTYHSFGSDIIKNYSEYFQTIGLERSDDIRMERPVDGLTQIQIVEAIVNGLPFDSPLLSARYYVKSVVSTLSDLKRNLIGPTDLRGIAANNLREIEAAQPLIDEVINSQGGVSAKKAQKLAQYQALLEGLSQLHGALTEQASRELTAAHIEAEAINSPTPLRGWKDTWLYKNSDDAFTLTEPQRSEKMRELANIYEAYEHSLKEGAAYDFDDMILRAIDGIEQNDELRFNLQERYQYILLDEFQDTNPSQFRLVQRIADHPVHEGRPNIMAVGDDDQAIFAFQGAHVGNMKGFLETFRDVAVINLTHNYRSHADILHVAHNIAEQISDRLHTQIDGIDKLLIASSNKLPADSQVSRQAFTAEASEYAWVATKIAALVTNGANASEIAVLAPKHRLLEGLVPFLKQHDVPVSYEKRENILETEIVQGLRLAAQLVEALINNDAAHTNQYLPLVLSLPYWQIPAQAIWQINWQLAKREEQRSWAEIALDSPKLEPAVSFYLALSGTAATEPLEVTLDKLIGTTAVIDADRTLHAPLRQYYFAHEQRTSDALRYFEAVSHLSVIRSRLRDYQAASDTQLQLHDFLQFFTMYEAAEAALINSHPVAQSAEAVQLMTAYKAKGLEFDHVFILQAHDDIWGSASTGGNNKLSLPANLQYIRYAGSGNDERLRLFFVALTRARHSLYISSHSTKDTGKATTPLKYLAEVDGVSAHLPAHAQQIVTEPVVPEQLAADIETLWQAGQVSLPADFRSLLADRLTSYMMSPTHLNTFLDVERGGPEAFLVQTLLRFPQAPSPSGEYGTAVHDTLEWYQHQLNKKLSPPITEVLLQYDTELSKRYLAEHDRNHARAKGRASLEKYITARADMFARPAKAEVNFYSEGVMLGEARLSGKIDRLEIDEQAKTVRIVDYKTGASLAKWSSETKAHKYKHQLYFYKFLVEGSSTWGNYRVEEARLEFVEPDKNTAGTIQPPLLVTFDEAEADEIKRLIKVVWQRIQTLDLPNIDTYAKSLSGVKAFQRQLLTEE
ncbi:ATP-dependent helicase [Aeromicrobium sp.]|nr:ATP-dependent helicase [Candidatus Saccharibacteria bacterium]